MAKQLIDPKIYRIGKDLSKKLKKQFKKELIALVFYGSRVRGDNFPDSDLDLLIVLNNYDENKSDILISNICGELTRKYFIKVSPYTISKKDFEFGCKNLFPFNLGIYLDYFIIYGKKFIENNFNFISGAIRKKELKVYPLSGIFIHKRL
ncbi:MAG: nucleotidyltransferase domain-containing protein [Candidatus Helarchaeota archaeon]